MFQTVTSTSCPGFSTWLGISRAPFLILAPVCVALGWASAVQAGAAIDYLNLVLILIGAVSAHVAVNALNEYDDFTSGLDQQTQRTPFSGGSGTLPAHPELAPRAKYLGLGALLLTILIGCLLIPQGGPGLLLLGAMGVLIIYTYTRWLNRLPWLCLIAPGLGFGLLMVLGTHLVLRGQLDAIAWQVALIPFFLTNNLLLLNQFPDIEADRTVGRRTLPIAYGPNFALGIYGLFGILTYLWISVAAVAGWWPHTTLLALIAAPLPLAALWGMNRRPEQLHLWLGLNVLSVLLTPALLALALLLS